MAKVLPNEFPIGRSLSIEELITALETIKEHCDAYCVEGCGHSCPCGKDGVCLLSHDGKYPKNWKIRSKYDFSDMKVMK